MDVDCAGGTFMFTDVPQGSLTLTFGLPSGDETIPLNPVGAGETLEVEVTIDANDDVTVVEVEREDSPSEDSVSEDSVSEDSVSDDSVSDDSVSDDSVSDDSDSDSSDADTTT